MRDIEWIISYGYLTCQGFSGFENDEEYTCNRLVDKLEKGIELSPKELINLKSSDHILKKDGTYKKYIESREYLYKTFSEPLGKPIYENDLKNLFILGSRSTGKDLEENTIVYTETGECKIKDVNIGDKIYGKDGKLTNITNKFNFNDQLQYKIELQDGREIECGGGHLWNVRSPGTSSKFKTLTTEFLYNNINKRIRTDKINHKNESYWFIPNNNPIEYDEKELPIDPYLLGLWLGDGSKNRVSITSADSEIVNYIYEVAKHYNHKVTLNFNKYKTCPTYHITEGRGKHDRELVNEFKKLNLLNNKHIPDIYLKSSINQRIELLKGLMDSDGNSNIGTNNCEFSNSNKRVIDDFEKLVRSLAISCKIKSKIPTFKYKEKLKYGKISYRVYLRPEFCPFKLQRKVDSYVYDSSKHKTKNCIGIKSITPTTIKPSVCISVDNKDNLFIAGNYIVTHNSFIISGIMAHCYNFYNKKYYDDKYLISPAPAEILVGAAQSAKSAELVKKFLNIQEYLKTNPGSFGKGKDFIPGYFYNNSMGKSSPNNVDSPYRHEYKVQEGRIWVNKGTGTKLLHVAYGDNPEAAVGYRPNLLIIEEIGLCSNLLQIHSCYGEDTKIRMLDTSLKNVQDIKIGDKILGHDGTERNVKNTFSGIDQLYKIKQRGGIDYVCNSLHNVRYFQKWGKNATISNGEHVKTAEEIYNFSKTRKRNIYGLKSGPLNFSKKNLLLDPYYLGLYIGDGVIRSGGIVIQNSEKTKLLSEWVINYFKSLDLKTHLDLRPNCPLYRPTTGKFTGGYNRNYIVATLRNYNILNKKEIPTDFLMSTEEDRLKLLAGIIDSDGTFCKRHGGRNYVISVSGREHLSDQIRFLAQSLGFKVSYCKHFSEEKKYKTREIITISGDIERIPVLLPHKKCNFKNSHYSTITCGLKIEKLNVGKYYGFTLEEDSRFLGEDNTVLENSNELALIRRNRTGISIYLGTSGDMDKIVESKILFEDPDSYDFLSYTDIWEHRSKPIGLFIPAYYADTSFKDDKGNTDLELAFQQELINRKKKEQASSSAALDGYMMSRPLVPSEMFLSSTANLFPSAKLRQREAEIETRNLFDLYASIGDLEWADTEKKSVKWKEDLTSSRTHRVIQTMNLDQYKHNINGVIVIYEHPPALIPNPTYRKSLYKVVYDPVKDDNGGTSLASVIVYKGLSENWNAGIQDGIVAEYIGRYDKVDDMHDLVLKIAHYYNATVLVENNIPGFINYCKINGYVHKLQISPYEAISKGMVTFSRKYEYGVTMSKQLNTHCEQLIRQWLLEPWKKEDDKLLLNLDKIYSLRIIRELITYERDKNFDHVSSLKLLVLWLSQERDITFKEEDIQNKQYDDLNKYFKKVITPTQKNPWFL